MTFEQKLAVLIGAAIAIAATVECVIRGWHSLQRWASRRVTRMVDEGLAILTVTDDDFAEYADEAIALTLPLAPLQAAAIAHAEAVRFDPNAVDWTETTEEHR